MTIIKMLKWSIMLVLATGSLSRGLNGASAERQEDRPQEPTVEERFLARQTRSASPFAGVLAFHSELQEDFPFAQDLGLPGKKLSSRRKRGAGVVIRGPFYPYPRPGHPLRFTSGGHGTTSSSLLVVASLLTVSIVATWRAW